MESTVSTDKMQTVLFLTINNLYHLLLMGPNLKLKQLLKTEKKKWKVSNYLTSFKIVKSKQILAQEYPPGRFELST